MKRCRCCRQTWPIEFYPIARRVDVRINGRRIRHTYRRATCTACRASAVERRRKAVARTKAYRERLRAEIQHVRSVRMSITGDGCESNTLRAGARSSAITRERASLVSVEVMAR